MNDPRLDTNLDTSFELVSVKWFPDLNQLEFQVKVHMENHGYEIKDYYIDHYDSEFEQLLPEGEFTYKDADTGIIYARLDDYHNLHWLIRDFKGFVHHKVVYLQPILEGIAETKFHE